VTSVNIFEQASREKFRFPSKVGMLSVENLWDLPLTSANKASLDDTAKSVNAELKSVTEESFVAITSNPAKAALETKLEIVKHIIAARLAENEAARNEAARRAEKVKLMEILERKQDATLEGLTEEQIRERIAAL
jgi:hypothetical protein